MVGRRLAAAAAAGCAGINQSRLLLLLLLLLLLKLRHVDEDLEIGLGEIKEEGLVLVLYGVWCFEWKGRERYGFTEEGSKNKKVA